MQLFARICNSWWRVLFLPVSALIAFLILLISAFLTVTQFDSDLPIYIFAMFPALIVVTGVCTVIAYVEWAYTHISSLKAMSELCCCIDSIKPEKVPGGEYSDFFRTRKPRLAETVAAKSVKYHVVAILQLYRRHKLFPVRPIRVEAGDFGHYIKIGAAAKLINDVLSYLIIILKLREFRLSEIS